MKQITYLKYTQKKTKLIQIFKVEDDVETFIYSSNEEESGYAVGCTFIVGTTAPGYGEYWDVDAITEEEAFIEIL